MQPRQRQILKYIVREFCQSGEPVGSLALAEDNVPIATNVPKSSSVRAKMQEQKDRLKQEVKNARTQLKNTTEAVREDIKKSREEFNDSVKAKRAELDDKIKVKREEFGDPYFANQLSAELGGETDGDSYHNRTVKIYIPEDVDFGDAVKYAQQQAALQTREEHYNEVHGSGW